MKCKEGVHMAEKVDLKAMSMSFRMKVSELAKFLGYTRQALYQINDGTQGICTDRYHDTLKLLKFQSDQIYEDDLQKAIAAKQEREKYIQQMCNNVGAINVTEQL